MVLGKLVAQSSGCNSKANSLWSIVFTIASFFIKEKIRNIKPNGEVKSKLWNLRLQKISCSLLSQQFIEFKSFLQIEQEKQSLWKGFTISKKNKN
jgi:hypothetical protein